LCTKSNYSSQDNILVETAGGKFTVPVFLVANSSQGYKVGENMQLSLSFTPYTWYSKEGGPEFYIMPIGRFRKRLMYSSAFRNEA
jgi:hypothetical protein